MNPYPFLGHDGQKRPPDHIQKRKANKDQNPDSARKQKPYPGVFASENLLPFLRRPHLLFVVPYIYSAR